MVLPVVVLLFAGLLLYSGIKDVSITDALRGLLGRPSTGGLGSLSGLSNASSKGNGGGGGSGGNGVTPTGSLSGHPELKAGISAVANTVLTQFPQLTITATTNGSHVSGSYHYQGRAVDIAGSQSVMDTAAKWIAQNLTSKLTEGIHNPGLSVKHNVTVPSSFWGAATWAGHANHIHLAV